MTSSRSALLEAIEAILVAVIFATFARTFVVQAFKIPSRSMERTLLVGDHILVDKFVYAGGWPPLPGWLPQRPIRRGDVVVFKYPEDPSRDFIKRCVGLPGDTIELVDKKLRVNGKPVGEESYALHTDPRTYPRSMFVERQLRIRDNFGPYRVPDDSFFFLGDNRDDSDDSRFWGPVPASFVKGRAWIVYWSYAGGGRDEEPAADLRSRVGRVLDVMLHFPTATRWKRTFRLVR